MNSHLEQAYEPENFRRIAHEIVDLLADGLQESLSTGQMPVLNWTDPQQAFEEVQSWFEQSRQSTAGSEIRMTELFKKVVSRSIRLHHPNFMGHQISPSLPIAAVAGMMSDLLNNGMGVFEMGIAGTAIERFVIKTVARKFGMGDQADGVLTSGGSLGNLTALLAARCVKAKANVWQTGNQQSLAILVSDQAHYCIDRAARVMGWGSEGVILVPTDSRYSMQTNMLHAGLEQANQLGRQVIAVVGSACSTATGSFDDLEEIGKFCQQHQLWFHVDGAHGAAVAFSEKYRSRIKGIERADSVTLDFHKLLMTPALATAVIYKNAKHGHRAFSQQADYLWSTDKNPAGEQDEPWHDLARRTFECTKTMTGLKIFSIMAAHGTEIFDANISALFDLAVVFAQLIDAEPDFKLATRPQANIVCFRYAPAANTDSATGLDELNRHIRTRVVEKGKFYIVQTLLDRKQWLRSTIANPFTTIDQMQGLLDHIREIAGSFSLPKTDIQ